MLLQFCFRILYGYAKILTVNYEVFITSVVHCDGAEVMLYFTLVTKGAIRIKLRYTGVAFPVEPSINITLREQRRDERIK